MVMLTVVVLCTVIYGFMDGGSPKAAKDKRDDDTRYQNLYTLRGTINSYYSKNKTLPTTLNEGVRPSNVSVSSYGAQEYWKDPETKTDYEYKILNDKEYQLCATFATDNTKSIDKYQNAFGHPSGYYCLTFSGDRFDN